MTLLRHAPVAALLLAAPLTAQDAPPLCPGDQADDEIATVSATLHAHPTRVASVMDSVLMEENYTVIRAPQGEGNWQLAPRFAWVEGEKEIAPGIREHPGIQLYVGTEARGDSTHLEVGAQVLCRPAGAGAKAEVPTALELMSALSVLGEFTQRMDTLEARGVAMNEPVERPGFALSFPDSLAGFAFRSRRDYDDPRLGASARYARADGMSADVYLYAGPPADSTCPLACAEEYAQEQAKEFADLIPELIRRGQISAASVQRNDAVAVPAGARWRAGRHLVATVEQGGQPRESHFYLFLFPSYQVKVRATFPASDELRQAVQALVDDALLKFSAQR
ncbi:MAG TPA: hypothetical protein VGB66_03820 [Longimicrobium sp.]|jgi:hypothetical protein